MGTTCNRDNSSPIPRLYDEMYPMRYTSPMNMAMKRRIDKKKVEEGDDEEDEMDQGDECVSVTRF